MVSLSAVGHRAHLFWQHPRRVACALLIAGTAGGAGGIVPSAAATTNSAFVSASGQKLMLNGRSWSFTGYNMFQLPSIAVGTGFNCGGYFPPSWLGTTLDQIRSSSNSAVIRTWFFQSYSGADYAQFDAVLAAAAARGIKILPVLVNEWGECEPNVNGRIDYKSLAWYRGGYRVAQDGYARSFRSYAIDMATRYANNPTIAFWQLVNEAEAMDTSAGPCEEAAAGVAIRSFADDVAGAMKAVDHNHLVNLGTIGTGQCGVAGTDYEYVHSGRIDICEYHDYTPGAVSGDPWNGIGPDLSGCRQLGKPIFAGETGLDASIQQNWVASGQVTGASLLMRANFFHLKMVEQFNQGAVGLLVWDRSVTGWSGGFDVGPGDPTEAMLAAAQQQLDTTGSLTLTSLVTTAGDPATVLAHKPAGGSVAAADTSASAVPGRAGRRAAITASAAHAGATTPAPPGKSASPEQRWAHSRWR